MLRFIASLATLALVVTPLTVWLAPAHDATACSVVADTLDRAVAQSDIIALVKASQVGGPENTAPTLTPTAAPSRTPTVAGSRTPTPRPATGSPTPTASDTPAPVLPEPPAVNLTGVGATLTVIESYFGAPPSTIAADAEQRARLERNIRDVEASRIFGNCPLDLGVYRYTPGVRYLALLRREESGALTTRLLFVVENTDVVPTGATSFAMSAATYHRFFEGIPASVSHAIDYAQLTVDRVPLTVILHAITALRTGESPPPITPPETGTAGLASGR